jgi:hypothetical protein
VHRGHGGHQGQAAVEGVAPDLGGQDRRIATNRNTLKASHLAGNPYLSLSYFDPRDP